MSADLGRALAALNLAVFVRQSDGSFKSVGEPPDWLRQFSVENQLLTETFPFLEVFMPEAEVAWGGAGTSRARSDIWTQEGTDGCDVQLQALALRVGECKYLVLDSPVAAFEERRLSQQRAHDLGLYSEKLERLQRQLSDTNLQLERATQAKSDFLATMSHEIRTPLNAILGMADLLWDSDLSPEQREYVRIFRRAGSNLLNLINDILDLSKVESGNLDLESTEFDLVELLQKTRELMVTRAQAKGLALDWQTAPGVPTALIGDPHRLRQILINLIGNSMKFTERGGIRIVVERDPDDTTLGALRFGVSDTGIGIPAEKLGSIFENFSQVDSSTTRKYGGTGLGLSISRRFVEMMKGRIWVESYLGEGSTFFFTARFATQADPFRRSEPAGTETESEPSSQPAQPLDLSHARILLADDNEDNRFLIISYLKGSGCAVETAENGAVAVEKFRAGHYDLVLMDVEMPEMDGYAAVKAIRDYERERASSAAPVLALTAHAFREAAEKSRRSGFTEHLTKPIRKGTLLRAVERYVPRPSTAGANTGPAKIRVALDDSIRDIAPAFLEKRRKDLPKLQAALAAADFEALRIAGHNLKGTGSGYGFPALTEIGAALESAAKERDLIRLSAKVVELGDYLTHVELEGEA